jgi:hypothetical protein
MHWNSLRMLLSKLSLHQPVLSNFNQPNISILAWKAWKKFAGLEQCSQWVGRLWAPSPFNPAQPGIRYAATVSMDAWGSSIRYPLEAHLMNSTSSFSRTTFLPPGPQWSVRNSLRLIPTNQRLVFQYQKHQFPPIPYETHQNKPYYYTNKRHITCNHKKYRALSFPCPNSLQFHLV